MASLETLWLLKQFVLPVMGLADLDWLAGASPVLSSMTRKQRMEMRERRLVVYVPRLRSGRPVTIIAWESNLLKIVGGMAGIRFAK